MSIIPNSFRKQKKYITDENGNHELVSTWTSTDTVETTDGETLTNYLDSHVDVTIDVTTPSEVAKRYTFTQNDTVIGVVDIPLDMVISGATVETVVTPDVPYEGAEVGDKYIDMVIANSSEDHIYIPCKDIISDDSVDKVKQSPSTTNSNYEILFSATADNTERTETTKKSNKLLYNPGSNQLRVSDNDNYVGIAEENIYIEHNSMDSSNMYVTLHDLRQGQRASVTPDHINVEQYDLDTFDSSILTMTHDDIELSDTWDGTNTSLKDAIADCGGGTDENVEQSNNTTNTDYRVLLSHSANDTTETAGTYKSAGLRYNPSKNALTMGSNNTTSGNNSIAEGSYTTASGDNSHSEGYGSVASGDESHAEGVATASGNYSHAEGSGAASGAMAHAEGYQTIANHSSQHVFGECNIPDDSGALSTERGNYVEIVGNGASTSQRSNARTLDWSGNEVLAGKLTVGVAPTNDMDVATKKYVDDNAGTSTDEKVKQMDSSTSSNFRLLLSNSANDTTETAEVKKNATLTYNPGTQSLKVAKNNNANQHTTIQSGGTITTNDPLHVAGSQNYLVDEYGNRKTSLDHNIDYYRSNNSQQFNGQIEANASYSEDDASGIMINVDMELTPNTFDPKLSFEKQVTDLGEGTTTTKTVEYGVEDITLSETWDGTHTSLKDAIANAGGGTTVVANPTGTATDTLNKLQVGSDIYSVGGGSGTTVVELTQVAYNALTQAEKENGDIYMVKDHNDVIVELTEPQTSSSTRVTASSYMVDYNLQQYHYPFGAFNRVSPTTWEYPTPGVTTETTWTPDISVDGTNSWIQYEFDAPVRMTSMKIWAFADYSGDTTKSFIIEGSNDGTTFTNILADGESSCDITATLHQNYENIIDLDDTDSYTYVRLRSLEPMGASYQPTIFIDEIFIYGYGTTSVNRIYYMDTEYANTEVGSGSSGDSYSTDEQIVGTWIDDRPLYQKTYYYPNSWTSTDRIILDSNFLPSTYDNFFETDIHFTVNNDYINGNGQMGSSGMEVFSSSSLGGLGLVNGVDSVTITNLYLTVRYTKVADL